MPGELVEKSVSVDASEVAAAVRKYSGEEIEQKLVDAHATVALSRTIGDWLDHPAGSSVHAEPIVHIEASAADGSSWEPTPGRDQGAPIRLAL